MGRRPLKRPPRVWRTRALYPRRWSPRRCWVGLRCELRRQPEDHYDTDDKIALRELLEKGSDATFLREMIGFAAERRMALEIESLCSPAPGERSGDRTNHRNGYLDATGRRGLVRSNCGSQNSAMEAPSRVSSSRVGWPRKRSSRKPPSRVSRLAPWPTWSKPCVRPET